MKNSQKTVTELSKKLQEVRDGASAVTAQPSDDIWNEIQRLSEERESRNSALVSRRPTK